MTLIANEFRKINGIRYLRVILAVLLLVNAGLCFVNTRPSTEYPDNRELTEFYETYDADPAAVQSALEAKRSQMLEQYFATGEFGEVASVYTSTPYGDEGLVGAREGQTKYVDAFKASMQKVVRSAETTMKEYDYYKVPVDGYLYRYQSEAKRIYTDMGASVTPVDVNPKAWESYFSYSYVSIFLFIAVIAVGSVIFLYERDCQTEMIVRAARRGRGALLASKLACAIFSAAGLTVLFSASTLAVYLIRGGMCDISLPIQTLQTFELCPFKLTIAQFIFIQLGYRILAASVFMLVTTAFALILKNYVLTYVASAAFYGINAVLSAMFFDSVNSPVRCFNLCTVASADRFLNRYIGINVFENSVNAAWVALVAYAALIPIFGALCAALYSANLAGVRLPKLRRKPKAEKQSRPVRVRYVPVFLCEAKKIFASPKILVFILAVLVLRGYSSYDTIEHHKSFNDTVFRIYIDRYAGEVTDEKLDEIAELVAEANAAAAEYAGLQQKLISGEIDPAEYALLASESSDAAAEAQMLRPLADRAEYLRSVREATNVMPHFVYDTGLNKLLSGDGDYFLYIIIVVLFTQSFVIEYAKTSSSGGFSQILRTTKKGRGATFAAKLGSSALLAAMLSVIVNAFDFAVFLKFYSLADVAGAPLVSLPAFRGITTAVTVGRYLVMMYAVRVFAAVLLSVAVCAFSALIRQYVPVLTATVLVTLVPHVVASAGMTKLHAASFFAFLDVNRLVKTSVNSAIGGDFTLFVIFAVSATAVCAALTFAAYRRFAK